MIFTGYDESQRPEVKLHGLCRFRAQRAREEADDDNNERDGLVRSGPNRGGIRPHHLRQKTADHLTVPGLDFLHGGVRLDSERGLREHGQRAAALRLQQKRRRLQLRHHHRRVGVLSQPLLPGAGRLLPSDQQREGPQESRAAGDGLLGTLGVSVVRGILFLGQSVESHFPERASAGTGLGRCTSRHRFLLLLHPHLGGADGVRRAEIPARNRHDALHFRRRPQAAVSLQRRHPPDRRRQKPHADRDGGDTPPRLPDSARVLISREKGDRAAHSCWFSSATVLNATPSTPPVANAARIRANTSSLYLPITQTQSNTFFLKPPWSLLHSSTS